MNRIIDDSLLKRLEIGVSTLVDTNSKTTHIEIALQRITKVKFKVIMVKNKTDKFFGMRIFPSMDAVIEIASRIANNRDYNIKQIEEVITDSYKDNWFIEIDSKLLESKLGLDNKEKTAILLHELGHFMDKNSYIAKMVQAYIIKKAIMAQKFKNIVRAGKLDFINHLFGLFVIQALSSGKFRDNVFVSELSADKFVVQNGYGEHLQSALTKICKIYRKDDIIEEDNFDKVKDNGDVIDWIVNSVNSLSVRQSILFTQLLAQGKVSNSIYLKDYIFNRVMPWIHDLDESSEKYSPEELDINNYKEKLEWKAESMSNMFKASYTTENLVDAIMGGKVRDIKEEDLDHIRIEIDEVRTKEDKVFVLDLIYDQLDLVDAAENLISQGKGGRVRMTPSRVAYCKERLLKMKAQLLDKKVTGGYTPIVVNTPKGYEG